MVFIAFILRLPLIRLGSGTCMDYHNLFQHFCSFFRGRDLFYVSHGCQTSRMLGRGVVTTRELRKACQCIRYVNKRVRVA